MSKPEVYLDMDGVLADFFTEYAKLAGIESGNYRDIPPAKTDPTLNKMVGTDFFNRLPKCPNADQVVAMAVKLYGHYNICSSPLRGDHENSGKWKKVWVQSNLNPQPKDIVITPNKAKWAKQADGTPNILIDDRGSNISSWEAAGGIGIKYQADEDGLDVIVDGFTRARKIVKGEEKHDPQKLTSKDRSMPVATDKDKPGSAADMEKENHEVNDPMQRNAIMAKESASGGSSSAGGVASNSATGAYGNGFLHGGPGAESVAPTKKKKAKVIKRS
jgi:5'(3')-deoxyribonucleotidase